MSTILYILLALVILIPLYIIYLYNSLVRSRNMVEEGWSGIDVQLKRRYELIPNLVETVKGFAEQEREVLVGVTDARSKVSSIQATPELINDPAAFAQFQAAQGELSSALSRLLVTVERYPELKSDQNFRDLQAQLEGTENRISVAFFGDGAPEFFRLGDVSGVRPRAGPTIDTDGFTVHRSAFPVSSQ